MKPFIWPVRVYYEDTDSGGVVYHANYLKFFERARTEWLRAQGYEQQALRENAQLLFVVHRMDVRFIRPAGFDDLLEVTLHVEHMRRARIVFAQSIARQACGTELCRADVTVAAVDARSLAPKPIPETIRAELSHAR